MSKHTKALQYGSRDKATVDGQAYAAAAGNYLYQQVAASAPAPATAGFVVPVQTFTPKVSGSVHVIANVDGIATAPTTLVTLRVTMNAENFTLTTAAGGSGDNSVSATLSHVFTGLTVGTPYTVGFTWLASGGDSFGVRNSQGGLLIQELAAEPANMAPPT